MEKVTVKFDEKNPCSKDVMSYFAQIFSSLDERPRKLLVTVVSPASGSNAVAIDLTPEGKIVFSVGLADSATADFRSRWIAEHEVPLQFANRRTRVFFRPAEGNRVKVSRASFFSNFI